MSQTKNQVEDPTYEQKMKAIHRVMTAIRTKFFGENEDLPDDGPHLPEETIHPAEVITEDTNSQTQTNNYMSQSNAVSNIQVIKEVNNTWENEKKKDLIALGHSNKSYPEILTYLDNEIKTSTKMVNFTYEISCFRNDGVYQLHQSIEHHIGVSKATEDKSPSGERPMDTLDVILSDGRRIKVPYGEIDLPDMGEDASIDIRYNDGKKKLYVKGTCQFKFQSLIDQIIETTKYFLNTQSIYKSQAIEISSGVNNGQPTIMNLDSVESDIMIMDDSVNYALSPLTARIEQPEKCIANNIPLKFGVLIEGPYGTGKTLYALKLGNKAIKMGWSFIYLKSPELLADTLRMAKTLDKNGHGIIVFVEDIDQVTRGDRNAAMQDILNTLDGGDTKNMNVISLFTTNHLELIEPTFLRGKRIGTIISMPMLTAQTSKQYIETFCAGIELKGDFDPVYKLIEDSNIAPAFMAEIIENVKSNMVMRDENTIEAKHVINCVNSYLRQVGLSRTKDTTLTREVALVNLLQENLMTPEFYQKIGDINKQVYEGEWPAAE